MAVVIDNENLTVIGRPQFATYAILAGLVVGVPLTAWGMWTSGEVSLLFVVLFILTFSAAAPFLLKDLIKPRLQKAVFDSATRAITITHAHLMGKSEHHEVFANIKHIETRITDGAPQSPSGGKRYHGCVITFRDGYELVVSSQNRLDRMISEYEQVKAYLIKAGLNPICAENRIAFVDTLKMAS